MKHLRGKLIVALVGLVVHAALLAGMPLVWCIGQHHAGLEICAVSQCHTTRANPSGDSQRTHIADAGAAIGDAHELPCADTAPIDALSSAPSDEGFLLAGAAAPCPISVAIEPGEMARSRPCRLNPTARAAAGGQRLEAHRSVVLLI